MSNSNLFLIGSRSDQTFRYVVRRALEEGIGATTIDLDHLLQDGCGYLDLYGSSYTICNSQQLASINESSVVYCRLFDYHLKGKEQDEVDARSQRLFGLERALAMLGCRVVPGAFSDGGNLSKPYQTARLSAHGFVVPESLSTNDPQAAFQFIERQNGNVIYKSVSSERSIVSKVSEFKLSQLTRIANCPVLFQQKVDGADIRLHVVGRECFAEEITANAVDYRYSSPESRRFKSWTVPGSIIELATSFMEKVGLAFAGFDFKVCNQTGRLYCLEANPNPGFEGYDYRAHGAISRALFALLGNEGNRVVSGRYWNKFQGAVQ